MADVETMQDLLTDALQDLHDAEMALVERLPGIADHARDAAIRAQLDDIALQSENHRRRLANLLERRGDEVKGASNIWLRAILDDAKRDCDMVAAGHLLDIALVGAIRKGKQAERVSYETAIALAEALAASDATTLETMRDEEVAAECLPRLCQAAAIDADENAFDKKEVND